jgi:alpha-ketoglutarate-dependent taurine dioxygenase
LEREKINFTTAGRASRKPIALSGKEVVRVEEPPDHGRPLTIQPVIAGIDLADWIATPANSELVKKSLQGRGNLLLRGFSVKSASQFESFVRTAWGDLLEYTYGSTPRSQVSGNIYTSTEYPADQSIPQHNEMSYTTAWPLIICFFCVQPAEAGGETPIADSRKVLEHIPPAIRERFARQGVMYVRNYGEGVDIPWQKVFQTEDPAEVEQYCHSLGIQFEWKSKNRLKTRQVCQAVARHPYTGEEVWFNQAHLFHISSLSAALQGELLAQFQEDDLPRNAYYGDGSPIEEAALMAIREAYQQETRSFPWQEGDIMVLDNMLVSHGRAPFTGKRRVVVGMAEPYDAALPHNV